MDMKKVVLKLNIHDDKDKQKVMKSVASLPGIQSLTVDLKESKMTVVGDVDPVEVVGKLKKHWSPEIVTVGPAKEEKKKEEEKKDQAVEFVKVWQDYHRHPIYNYNYHHPYYYQENPNSCVIS